MNEKNFTRQRRITFARLCVLIAQKTVRSLHAHLSDFFAQLLGPALRSVGASAFTQARAKLKHTAFIELNEKAVLANIYTSANAPLLRRWRGFRLVAIDSSLLRLPNHRALAAHFGRVECRNQSGATTQSVQARLSMSYDLLNQFGLQALVGSCARGERQVAMEHLARLEPEDLAVMDRGYSGYELFVKFLEASRAFVCRCERNTFKAVQELFEKNQGGLSVIVCLRKPAALKSPSLPASLVVRLVSVALPNGELEVLATSLLDMERYPTAEFAEVYGARWGIETYYGRLKGRLDLERFSGHTVEAILQDIHATVYLSNLETALIGPAQEELASRADQAQEAQRVNHAVAFHAIKSRMIELLLSDQPLDPLLEQLKGCFLRNAQPHRANRAAPRTSSVWSGYHFQRNVRRFIY